MPHGKDTILQLKDFILGAGASRAVVIDTSIIVVLDRPACGNCPEYGRNLRCPPVIPPPGEFRRKLAGYRRGVLFQVRVPVEPGHRHAAYRGSDKVHHIVLEAERACRDAGNSRVCGLIAGCCRLCHPCAGPGNPCNHPQLARSSLEANGIDVADLCARVGWPVKFPVTGYVDWTGLVLV